MEIMDGGTVPPGRLTPGQLDDKSDVIVIANACVTVSVPD